MKHLLQHFKTLTKYPQNANELKLLIKRLALEGKLTSDWRNENSKFSGLTELEELKGKSTNRLSKRDKNEMQSVLYSFTKDDFPNSWGLCNLSEIADFWNGKAHESSVEENGGFVLVNSRFVSTNGSRVKKVTSRLSPLKKSEIAIVMSDVPDGRALSRCYIVEENDKYTLNQRIGGITPVEGVSSTFLAFVLDRNPHYLAINDGKKQTNLKRIHMISCPIPFPPLEEQKAIVAIVNELFKEVEQLEDLTKTRIQLKEEFVTSALKRLTETDNVNQEWQFLQTHFTEFFIEKDNVKQLRNTILQLAVQGKLTEKWRRCHPELVEGSHHASELLKRIQIEKQALIAQKKIKTKHKLHQKAKKEPTFSVPGSWETKRFWDVIWCFRGHNPPKSEFIDEPRDGYVRFVQITDFKTDTRAVYVPDSHKLKRVKKGEILMAAYRHIGKLSRKMEGAFNVALCKVNCIEPYNIDFLEMLIGTSLVKGELLAESERGHIPSMHSDHLLSLWIPIPPLEEQKAIVKEVNSLMALCDSLEEHIQNSQTQIEQLMQSCLRAVFEEEKQNEMV